MYVCLDRDRKAISQSSFSTYGHMAVHLTGEIPEEGDAHRESFVFTCYCRGFEPNAVVSVYELEEIVILAGPPPGRVRMQGSGWSSEGVFEGVCEQLRH